MGHPRAPCFSRQSHLVPGIGVEHRRKVAHMAARLLAYAISPVVSPVGFYDDDPMKWGQTIDGTPVLGPVGELSSVKRLVDGLVIAIGFDNKRRATVFDEMRGLSYEMVSVIHPRATISATATHGIGLVAFAGAVINTGA